MAVSLGAAKKSGAAAPAAKQESKGRVSLNPDTFTAGGAGPSDVNVTFVKCRFAEYDYNGTVEKPTLALECELLVEGEKNTTLQYFSAGDLNRFQPSEDGRQLEKVGSAETLNNNTNFNTLIKSIRDAGFPSDKLDTEELGIGALDGLYAHVQQIPQQKRAGLEGSKDGKTVMVVDKILKLPWENTASKASNIAKRAAAPAPGKKEAVQAVDPPVNVATAGGEESSEWGDVEAEAAGIVIDVIAERGVTKFAMLVSLAFKAVNKSPNNKAIIALLKSKPFAEQGSMQGLWAFDGSEIGPSA